MKNVYPGRRLPFSFFTTEFGQNIILDSMKNIIKGYLKLVWEAALGAGIIRNHLAVDGLGTTECIIPAFDKAIISVSMVQKEFTCVPHFIPDIYVTDAFTFTCSGMLKWYKGNFGSVYVEEAKKLNMNPYEFLIKKVSGESRYFHTAAFCGRSDTLYG